jgi:hypothetical protein
LTGFRFRYAKGLHSTLSRDPLQRITRKPINPA